MMLRDLETMIHVLFIIHGHVEVVGGTVDDYIEDLETLLKEVDFGALMTIHGYAECIREHTHRVLNDRADKRTCYQCGKTVAYLFSDSRCGSCTGDTLADVLGESS